MKRICILLAMFGMALPGVGPIPVVPHRAQNQKGDKL